MRGCALSGRRRLGRALLIAASGVALVVESSAELLPAPEVTWSTNGRVTSILRVGDRIYLGGAFTALRSPSGEVVEREHLAALDAGGELERGWDPQVDGRVFSLAASPDGTRIYAGGAFASVDGDRHANMVALEAGDGRVESDFAVHADLPVRAVEVAGTRLYLGGAFRTLESNGVRVARRRLAAVDLTTNEVNPAWRPAANGTVRALQASANGSRIYLGGDFTAINGRGRKFLAAVDPALGILDPTWRGDVLVGVRPCGNGCIIDLTASDALVYAAVGGVAGGNRIIALDAPTGELRWDVLADGDAQAVALLGERLYAGGHWKRIANRIRPRLIALHPRTGRVDLTWRPTVNSAMGVWSIVPSPEGGLYIGGDFTRVSGMDQQGFASFADDSVD